MYWKILLLVGIVGMLIGLNLILGEMFSSYPPFIEPGTTYWQVKFPRLIPGLGVTIGSFSIFMVGLIHAIKSRKHKKDSAKTH